PSFASMGEILPGYPGSVVVSALSASYDKFETVSLLDCIITQDAANDVCYKAKRKIAGGDRYRNRTNLYSGREIETNLVYIAYVCPSCVLAHDNVSGSGEVILNAFIQWFLKLDKSQRRQVISFLGDDDKAYQSRWLINNESGEAVEAYWKARERIEQQEQEGRRRELLGN
ncbi:MAG: hypothetical protein ACYTXT_14505, partial [Nostoc sp.]